MALKEYVYLGRTIQIADEDLALFPGAVLREEKAVEPETKKTKAPANKARKSVKNKGGDSR